VKPKEKGDLALGKAIAYFISTGYEVCLPIGDKRDYDLVIEKNGRLSRVQVKYGGLYRNKQKCTVALRVMGGNQSFFKAKKYKHDSFEHLFIYTAKGETYLLPWNKNVLGKSSISIEAPRYKLHRINALG
jgi:hypothetical protein